MARVLMPSSKFGSIAHNQRRKRSTKRRAGIGRTMAVSELDWAGGFHWAKVCVSLLGMKTAGFFVEGGTVASLPM